MAAVTVAEDPAMPTAAADQQTMMAAAIAVVPAVEITVETPATTTALPPTTHERYKALITRIRPYTGIRALYWQ